MMSISYDVIGEILKFSDDLMIHMNVRMLSKGLRKWLKNERGRSYCDIIFSIKGINKKKPDWIGSLRVDYIDNGELKYLKGTKRLYILYGKNVIDKGLVHLKGIKSIYNVRKTIIRNDGSAVFDD
jgi:hypothetical protein